MAVSREGRVLGKFKRCDYCTLAPLCGTWSEFSEVRAGELEWDTQPWSVRFAAGLARRTSPY